MAAIVERKLPLGGWLQKNGRWLLVIAAIVLVSRACIWWVSPEHRIEQFIGGVNGDAAHVLIGLADPQEVARVQLTEPKLARMLADLTSTPGGVRVGSLRWEELNEQQVLYNRWGEVQLQDAQGRPVTDYRGRSAKLMVEAYNTDAGWKIGLTNFLLGVIVARHGLKGMGQRYWELTRPHQVLPAVFNPSTAEWTDMSPPPGYLPLRPTARTAEEHSR
jgi:hypothetical protein